MIAVGHQEAIEVSVTAGCVVEISSESFELGHKISIFVQPENVEALCDSLLEMMNLAQETALIAK